VSGRGCPYRCSYCFNHSMHKLTNGKYVRRRSVDNLVEEVVEVKEKYRIRMVDFLDDVFIMNERWLEEFAEKFPRQVGLPFGCNVRADLVNDRNSKLLREAGCIEVAMGVESGNDRLRNELLERGLSKEQIIGAARRIRKEGMRLVTQNMIALPEETVENVLETVDLNLKCSPDFSGFSFYQPYPGTRLCDYAVRKGLFDGQIDHLPLFFSQKVGPCADEKKMSEFFKIVKLYPLIYLFPVLYPLFRFSMIGKGRRGLRTQAFRMLVLINLLKQVTALPRGFLYLAWLAITRERTRYHYYKWFSRRLAFLWRRILRTEAIS
jgi:anaerobic magnesium-protoporphyrin IX monomethyl ester cyclase